MSKKAIFIDLDGALIETASGKTYPTFIGDIKFKDGILDALKNFVYINDSKYMFIIDNQNGIEKQVSENSFIAKINFITRSVFEYINNPDINITNYYYKYNCYYYDYYQYNKSNIRIEEILKIGGDSRPEGQFLDLDKKTIENFSIDYFYVNEFIKMYKTEENK